MDGRIARWVVGGILVALLATGPGAAAGEDVVRRGACSGRSDWKLKLSPEDGGIEVEFEVDQNVVGDRWRVVLRHDGEVVSRGTRTTRPPSGSFTARIVEPDLPGLDRFRARAVNLRTGELCIGRASM